MPKYHIHPDGYADICRAEKGKCPFGGADQHYNTFKEAQAEADRQNESKIHQVYLDHSFEERREMFLEKGGYESLLPKKSKVREFVFGLIDKVTTKKENSEFNSGKRDRIYKEFSESYRRIIESTARNYEESKEMKIIFTDMEDAIVIADKPKSFANDLSHKEFVNQYTEVLGEMLEDSKELNYEMDKKPFINKYKEKIGDLKEFYERETKTHNNGTFFSRSAVMSEIYGYDFDDIYNSYAKLIALSEMGMTIKEPDKVIDDLSMMRFSVPEGTPIYFTATFGEAPKKGDKIGKEYIGHMAFLDKEAAVNRAKDLSETSMEEVVISHSKGASGADLEEIFREVDGMTISAKWTEAGRNIWSNPDEYIEERYSMKDKLKENKYFLVEETTEGTVKSVTRKDGILHIEIE